MLSGRHWVTGGCWAQGADIWDCVAFTDCRELGSQVAHVHTGAWIFLPPPNTPLSGVRNSLPVSDNWPQLGAWLGNVSSPTTWSAVALPSVYFCHAGGGGGGFGEGCERDRGEGGITESHHFTHPNTFQFTTWGPLGPPVAPKGRHATSGGCTGGCRRATTRSVFFFFDIFSPGQDIQTWG